MSYRISLCTAPNGSYASAVNSSSLEVSDYGTGELVREDPPSIETRFNTDYELELHHDGSERLTLWRDGKEILDDACGPRRKGGVEIWAHNEYVIHFDDLEITGRITEESLAAFWRSWVEGRLKEMQS